MSSTTEAQDSAPQEKTTASSSPSPDHHTFFIEDAILPKTSLPQWLDHFNAKDLHLLFKASLAVWIMTLLILIDPALNVIGQATFFGCIVLFIVPPTGVVLVHVLAGLTICIGVALGWAWGAITMKSALSTRPQADLDAQYTEIQQAIAQGRITASGSTPALQVAVYEGYLLDTRVSMTYFCMMGLFIYLVARIRVAAPKLSLISIFALIVADIYLASAPMIPVFQGTIPQVLILPTAIAVGIGLVCNVMIFPQSTSSIVLDAMRDILEPMPSFFQALGQYFEDPTRRFDPIQLKQLKAQAAAAYNNADTSVKFLPMDFSYGRWGPEDVGSLHQPMRQLSLAFTELVQLPLAREQSKEKETQLLQALESLREGSYSTPQLPVAHHQITRALVMRDSARHPHSMRIATEAFAALASCTSPLFQAWYDAIAVICEAMSHTSGKRAPVAGINLQKALEKVRDLGKEFKDSSTHNLLQPNSHLFDPEGNLLRSEDGSLLLPLLFTLLCQERIINFSDAILAMLLRISQIEESRQRSQLWMPKGLAKLFSWTLAKDEVPSTVPGALDLKRITTAASVQGRAKRKDLKKAKSTSTDPDGRVNAKIRLEDMRTYRGRPRSRASTVLLAVIVWLTDDEGLHALRTLIVTIALAVPAILKSSAGFYYREKGFWALIMAQMALVPHTSDFVSGLLVRVAGTVVGGILGLVCWYIGSGNGPGNPYGIAAIMAVAIVVLMWWRLFAPPEQMQAGIMMASTIYLVVSYSWIDTHSPTYGDPGVGYNVFWRRLLLVLIGFGAATIVLFLPRPPSGSRYHRELLAQQLTSIKERYALFISTWQEPPSDLVEVSEMEALKSQEVLESSLRPIELLKFEFSSSNINSANLLKVCNLCLDMNTHITQLVVYTSRLPPPLRSRFMQTTAATTEGLVADLMAVFSLVQGSLITGKPLPAVIPTPLLHKSLRMHDSHQGQGEAAKGALGNLTVREILAESDGRLWASTLGAYVSLLGEVDELVIVLKKAVGEECVIDIAALAV